MKKSRSVTCSPRKPDLTKRAIELRAIFFISFLGDKKVRRDIAADKLDVSRKTVDAWCAAGDPRIIGPEQLLELAVEATLCLQPEDPATAVFQVVDAFGDVIAAYERAAHAVFVADMRNLQVTHRDGGEIRLTEQEMLRSRLRRIMQSGYLTAQHIREATSADEYGIVDKVIELRMKETSLNEVRIGRLDRVIVQHYDEAWAGAA